MRKSICVGVVVGLLGAFTALGAAESGAWDQVSGPPGAWVYIVVAGYDSIQGRIEAAAAKISPEAAAEIKMAPQKIREGLAEGLGLPGEAVDLSKPMAFAIFNPMMMGGEGPVASIVPVKSQDKLPESVKVVNGYAISAESSELATRVRGALEKAGAAGIGAPSGAARIYVDWGSIFQFLGPMAQLQLSMAMSQAPGGNAQAASAMMDILFSLLGQVENFALDLDATGGEIQAVANAKAKEGSDLAQLCQNQTGGTALGSLLGKGAITASAKLNGLSGWAMRLTERLCNKMIPDPKEAETVRNAINKMVGKISDEAAVSYSFTPEGLQADAVMGYTGSMDDMREYFRYFTSDKAPESFKKLMAGGAEGIKTTLSEGVRTVGDVPVDKFSTDMSQVTSLDPMVKRQMQAMFGHDGMTGEFALAGGKLVFSTGGKDASQRLDQLIAKAKAPASGAAAGAPVTFSVDMLQIIDWGVRLAGMPGAPAAAQGGTPITGSVSFSGRTISHRVAVPLDTVSQIVKLVQSFEGTAPPGGAIQIEDEDKAVQEKEEAEEEK